VLSFVVVLCFFLEKNSYLCEKNSTLAPPAAMDSNKGYPKTDGAQVYGYRGMLGLRGIMILVGIKVRYMATAGFVLGKLIQLADKPTRCQSSLGLVNSQTSQLSKNV